ncbi:MAG TPA: hypothetical protein DCP92_17410 [Nitrospiraceae bacterium]|jgi:DNA-binding MarR family transcriptional regulator|nr:hypothetical protein [Nitrospiraceae bacterium]
MQLPKELSCIDKLVLVHIAMKGEDEYSISLLSNALSVSRKSIHLALKRLVSKGYLHVTEVSSGRRATAYKINTRVKKIL